jgi:hypothetical protein
LRRRQKEGISPEKEPKKRNAHRGGVKKKECSLRRKQKEGMFTDETQERRNVR